MWAEGGEVRAGAAAWVIESGDARIVVDPRSRPTTSFATTPMRPCTRRRSRRCSRRPASRESFTHAIATHYDGVGMLAWRNDDGSWTRFFPNAPILMSQRELDAIDAGAVPSERCMPELRARRARCKRCRRPRAVTGDVSVELTGGHAPGHQIVRDRLGRRACGDRRPSRGQRVASRDRANARRSTSTGRRERLRLDKLLRRGRRADRPAVAGARRGPLERPASWSAVS